MQLKKHQEHEIQTACVRYFRLAFPQYSYMLFAVPNGGARTQSQGAILKQEGVVAGVADMILLTPRGGYGSLCLEFKTDKGRQSQPQKKWQEEAERHGNKYVIVRSFDDFKKAVEEYLIED